MAKYLGVLILLIGAILLIIAGVTQQDTNILLGSGLGLVLVGYLAHIFLNRKLA